MEKELSIFWFRRDLRLEDNAGLYHALKSGADVLPIFIFDTEILDKLEDRSDRRVHFIHAALENLQKEIAVYNSSLHVFVGKPLQIFNEIVNKIKVNSVYTNHDYEPLAIQRDEDVRNFLQQKGISFYSYKDQCIFEKDEVLKDDGKPYTVFTPYSVKWKKRLNPFYYKAYSSLNYAQHFYKCLTQAIPSLQQMGFKETDIIFKKPEIKKDIISAYAQSRDFPAVHGTTRLSVHLRFGTISIRQLVSVALPLSEIWLNELIWRDFYMMILYHFPHVAQGAFKPAYNHIPWRNNENDFKRWCAGQTGYPIVDAGMRELNTTGFMHNRVRMIVASFLTKHLLIDWRWGEAYFAQKLLDFDLSANNGGWQWAAGSGCDAAPYFRVFNPYEQTKKFDPDLKYIKKWVLELDSLEYPTPMVEHAFARNRALETYRKALKEL